MRTSRRTAAAFTLALVALSGQWDESRTVPERCAARLGVSWTAEDGATERLEAFERCTR